MPRRRPRPQAQYNFGLALAVGCARRRAVVGASLGGCCPHRGDCRNRTSGRRVRGRRCAVGAIGVRLRAGGPLGLRRAVHRRGFFAFAWRFARCAGFGRRRCRRWRRPATGCRSGRFRARRRRRRRRAARRGHSFSERQCRPDDRACARRWRGRLCVDNACCGSGKRHRLLCCSERAACGRRCLCARRKQHCSDAKGDCKNDNARSACNSCVCSGATTCIPRIRHLHSGRSPEGSGAILRFTR
jgi:hypothetical protein